MHREYHKWQSPALERAMELLVFGDRGERVLVFPSRKQRFFEYEDHGMVHALRHRIEAGTLQLICVDSVDEEGLYCFEIEPEQRLARHLQYERYVVEEVLPFAGTLLDSRAQKSRRQPRLATHGCSFGAYHALTIAMRHPQYFSRVVAFSGRYDLTLQSGDFHSLFHGFESETLHAIMPSYFLPRLRAIKRLQALRELQITLVIGEDDPFHADNLLLAAAMKQKRIPHALHEWDGEAHRFRFWRQMARIYL